MATDLLDNDDDALVGHPLQVCVSMCVCRYSVLTRH